VSTTAVPRLSQLHTLEAEAVHIMREVAAQLEHPVLRFSGGKDSIVLVRLAEKAFRPGAFPFPSCTGYVDVDVPDGEAPERTAERVLETLA
jgi:3'-phosphoadenosine 5'-phosphosulfate sulfotransferase (PAPS reductase)/FAD synthetase